MNELVENPDFLRFEWTDPSPIHGRIPPEPQNPLGLRWVGFASAHGWTIGFRGTPKPGLLGQTVSHGCVRMRNSDVVRVYDLVEIGTRVIVEPRQSGLARALAATDVIVEARRFRRLVTWLCREFTISGCTSGVAVTPGWGRLPSRHTEMQGREGR